MQCKTDTVTAVITYHAESVRIGMVEYRCGNIMNAGIRFTCPLDTHFKAFLRYSYQFLVFGLGIADDVRFSRIAEVSTQIDTQVDADQVPFSNYTLTGNSVNDFIIQRNTG